MNVFELQEAFKPWVSPYGFDQSTQIFAESAFLSCLQIHAPRRHSVCCYHSIVWFSLWIKNKEIADANLLLIMKHHLLPENYFAFTQSTAHLHLRKGWRGHFEPVGKSCDCLLLLLYGVVEFMPFRCDVICGCGNLHRCIYIHRADIILHFILLIRQWVSGSVGQWVIER